MWAPRPSPLADELCALGYHVYGEPRTIAFSLRTLRSPPGALRRTASLPRYFGRLRELVRELSPVLVHTNAIDNLAEVVAIRSLGVPIVMQLHQVVPRGVKGAVARLMTRVLADDVVAVSRASAESVGLGRRTPRVVFGATRLPREPAEVRREPSPFVVGTVGVISPRKGSDIFVEAARRALEHEPRLRFRMLGPARDPLDPEWGRQVLDRARRLGIEYTPDSNVPAELRRLDAFVLASRVDAFPVAMLEAMAMGLPVLGTRVEGIPEQLTPECGVLVSPEDPDALARAIVRLARAPYEQRAAMGAAARRRVKEHFTLERQAEGLESAYADALR
jgi:glycosyltransferase involved in cell wall biosynthesis